MAIFGNVFDDEEKKDGSNSTDTITISKPSGKIFGDVFAEQESQKQQQVESATEGLTASTETREKRGFFAKAVDAGKNTIKFGLEAWNTLQRKNDEASLEAINLRRIGKPKYATIEEARADAPLIRMMNTETGKKVISEISEQSSNIPLKVAAGAKSAGYSPVGTPLKTLAGMVGYGDKIYDEAYASFLAERNDPTNKTWEKFLYELQDTGVQSTVGALLALGTAYVTRSAGAGYAVSSAYYTALSADEQLVERGKVDSLGNIAIDVVGDQMLNTLLLKIMGGEASKSVLTSALKGFGVEGSTEVAQSLLKYANDYGGARTEEEKQKILDNAKRYVVDGGMAMEFFVGGTVGGILGAGTQALSGEGGAETNVSSQPNKETAKPKASPRFVPEVEDTDIAKVADELVKLERTLDPNDEAQVSRVLTLRDIMNDYVQAFSDRTAYVPSDTTDSPLIKVETAKLPNGNFVVKYEANVEGNGTASVYDYSQTFTSQEEATKDALTAIIAWAQSQEAQNETQKVGYEKILDYAKNPRAPLPPQIPKEKAPKVDTTKQKTVKPRKEERIVVYRGTSDGKLAESIDTDYGDGYYFTRLKETAGGYGKVVRQYTVGLSNPLKVKNRYEMNTIIDDYLGKKERGETKAERVREFLRESGYDGIIVEDGGLAGQEGIGGFVIAFNREQVKEEAEQRQGERKQVKKGIETKKTQKTQEGAKSRESEGVGKDDLNTARGVAKALIRPYVERGDSLKSLRDGQMSSSEARGTSVGIIKDKIVVKSLRDGKKLNPPIRFSLASLYKEIQDESAKKARVIEKNKEVAENVTVPRVESGMKRGDGELVRITDKKTGKSQEVVVISKKEDGSLVTTRTDMFFPTKTTGERFDIEYLGRKVKIPDGGITFGELDAMEKKEDDITQYHGTQNKDFGKALKEGTVRVSRDGIMGSGFYVAPSVEIAEYFGKQVNVGNGRTMNGSVPDIYEIDLRGLDIKRLPYGKGEYYDFLDKEGLSPDGYNERLKLQGYDGLNLEGRGETVIFDPKKVKGKLFEKSKVEEVVGDVTVPKKRAKTKKEKSRYATQKEAFSALEDAGRLEGTIDDVQRFGSSARGVYKTLKSDDFLAGGLREGILTDSFLLIKDRAIVEKEVERLASKWRMVFATIKSRVETAPFPDTKFLFDKPIGEEATVEGYYLDKKLGNVFVSLKHKSGHIAVSADKLAYMTKMLPEATMHVVDNMSASMLQFARDGEAVGFLMGVQKGGNPFEIEEKVKHDYKIPKSADAFIDARTAFGEVGGLPEVGGAELPKVMGGIKEINPIEMPELVDIARELSGEVPAIKKRISSTGTLGLHQAGRIKILASLFEQDNLQMASKVMAHEIGHLIDYMPDRSPNRNRNLIGRIYTLRNFMKETFHPKDGSIFTTEERAEIRREVESDYRAKNGIKTKEKLSLEQKAEVKKEYKRIVKMVLDLDGFVQEEVLEKELIEATRYWNPYDPDKVPPSYKAYRESTAELYAEALSMLFNAPNRLRKIAPTFYERFFEALDKKPNVRNVYFELQALLSGDRELILKRRREGVKTMFKEGDYKAIELHNRRVAEKEERRKQYWAHFKHTVIDKNFQIIDRVKKAQREGKKINPDENPVYFLEERNYLGGKIKAVFERDFNEIYRTLLENEISWEDFGEVLFYARIGAGDRSDVANPRGITPDAAKELVKDVVKDYTPEQRAVITEQAERFNRASKKITEEAFEAGLYKPELYEQMQKNPAYVTFQVLDYLEEGMTSRIYKSIGTLKDIANPADATMLKVISTIRATERNRTTQATVKFLRDNFPEDIEEAKYTGSKKGRFPVPSKDSRKELITYFEKGVMKGYYVDPYIAETINNQSVGANAPIVPAIRFMNGTFFRPLFIQFNLGFQAFNLIRDFWRTYKNFPDMTFLQSLKRYADPRVRRLARVRAFGMPKNPTALDTEAMEMLIKLEEEKVLSITYNDIIHGQTDFDTQVEKILAETGIKDFQVAPHLDRVPRFAKPVVSVLDKAGILKVTSGILGFIENLGNLIETLPKAAGTYYLIEQNEGTFLTQEQQSFIRRKIGSPDFLAGGTYKPITNELFLFSNAIIQGIRSDIEIATDPTTRAGWWWKTTKIAFLPKILMFAVLYGALGDEWKELMESASEYDRTNYIIIPLGKDKNGKAIYFRIPLDETSRFLGGLFWKALTMARNEQSIGTDLMNVMSYTGGQLPSISPAVQSFVATTQYLSGQNPYDWFRGRNVISDTVFKAGGTDALKSFLGWEFQQLGGGVFYRFYHEPLAPKPESTAEKVFNLPALGNIIGRFVRVSDYGKLEELKNVEKRVEKEEAQQTLKDRELVNKYLRQAQEQNIRFNTRALEDALIREAFDGLPDTQREADRADRLAKKLRLAIKRGDSDANVVSLIDANTNAQKLELLKVIREDMTADEFEAFKRDLLENKIVSVNVFDEFERGE